MRDFLRHGSLVFTGLIAANVLTYIYYASVSRALGVENAGLFTSLISAILIAALPGNVGATILAKIVADAWGAGERGVPRLLGNRILVFLPALAAVASGVAMLGGASIRTFFHTSDSSVVAFALAGCVVTLVLAPQRAVLQGVGAFSALSFSNVAEGVGRAVTGIAVLLTRGGIRMAFAGYVVASGLTVGLNALLVRRVSPQIPKARIGRLEMRAHLGGIALPIASITAMTFADVVLARHYLGAFHAGLYGAVALVGRALLTVIAFVPTVLLPKAAARASTGESSHRLLFAALGTTSLVVGGTLGFVAIAPRFVVTAIAGRAFAAAAPYMMPYTVAMASLAGATVLASFLIGIGRRGFAWPLTSVAAIEISAIVAYHPSIEAILHIVVGGHTCALLCCVGETISSLRRSQVLATVTAEDIAL